MKASQNRKPCQLGAVSFFLKKKATRRCGHFNDDPKSSEEKWVKRFGQLNDMFVYKKSLIMETRLGYSISGEDEEIIEYVE